MNRQPQNYVADPQFLQDWFMMQACPTWNLYRGFHSNVPERDVIHKQRQADLPIEDSWELLWRMINANSVGGGRFTIYVPVFKGNKAATLHFGHNLQPVPVNPWQQQYYPAGVSGMPMNGVSMVGGVENYVAKERELWELKRQVEDLEAAQEAKMTATDMLIAKIAEVDPNTALPALMGWVNSLIGGNRPQVQLHGVQSDMQQPTGQHNNTSQGQQPTGYEYPHAVLIPWLDSVRQHFDSDESFWQFMNGVSVKFNENPTMFKNLMANG